jgi:hypothetical protein
MGDITYQHDFAAQWVWLDLQGYYNILFAVNLKHSCFYLSADVKPVSNDLVHAVHTHGSACLLSL